MPPAVTPGSRGEPPGDAQFGKSAQRQGATTLRKLVKDIEDLDALDRVSGSESVYPPSWRQVKAG